MKEMGIKSILIVSGRGHAGHFLELLGSGSQFGLKFAYEVQEEAGGIAQALGLARDFIDSDKFAVMLGDNVFEDDLSDAFNEFSNSEKKAHVFLKEVVNPEHYGVARFEAGNVVEILEKPPVPPSSFAVTGCYLYSAEVFDQIKTLQPSARGELEITDVNDFYVKNREMSYSILDGFWGDCGESIDGLLEVAKYLQSNL